MADPLVSLRLNERIKSSVDRQARRDELTFSDVCRLLLKAYAKGDIQITTKQRRAVRS